MNRIALFIKTQRNAARLTQEEFSERSGLGLRFIRDLEQGKEILRIHRVKLQTFAEARRLIDEYIYFYNNQRIQLKTKLTPLEKRSQFVA